MGDPEENEMGWMVGWGSKRELVEHLIANAKGSNCELVKHSVVGNNLWMLLKLKDGGRQFILLNKLQAYRKDGGMKAIAAGWEGAIRTTVYHDEATGNDMYRVELIPWGSSGGSARVISEGVLNAKEMN